MTITLHFLEGPGMIRSNRGCVIIQDREKLEDIAGDAYAVMRKNIVTGCMMQMFGEVTSSTPGNLTLSITATDGACDLPNSFAETSEWQKA